jgi:hypothetical protein
MPRALLAFFAGALLYALGCTEPLEPLPPPTVTRPSAQGVGAGRDPEPPVVVETPFVLEDGFRLLARADFDSFQAEEDTWQAIPEGIRCSGKPKGYLHSKESFQNFTLRLSYRFPWPEGASDSSQFKGNTGFLVYISGEHKIWPVCLEVQGKYAEMGAIKENGGAARPDINDRDDVRQNVRKPVGQWNDLEIVSRDGHLTVWLNGEEVARSEPAFLSSGPIGIQAEGFPFEVRRMRIRVDP